MQPDQAIKIRRDVTLCPKSELKPAARNPRTHSRKQLKQIADSIQRFGFTIQF